MYNYIFWVVYNRNINRNKSKWLSRHNASGAVFFALFVHVIFVMECIKAIFKFKPSLEFLTINRVGEGIFFLLCILLTYLFYTENRIAKIVDSHSNDRKNGMLNGLIVLMLIFIPLCIIIILGWKKTNV